MGARRAELTLERGGGASPGPMTLLVCVLLGLAGLMAASLFAISKAFARTSKASTVMPSIELTTDMGKLEKLQMGKSFGSFHHRAWTDVDVRRNTERWRKPPDLGTERAFLFFRKPQRPNEAQSLRHRAIDWPKNIRIQWQKNSLHSKKLRYNQRYFGRDSVKTPLISRYL